MTSQVCVERLPAILGRKQLLPRTDLSPHLVVCADVSLVGRVDVRTIACNTAVSLMPLYEQPHVHNQKHNKDDDEDEYDARDDDQPCGGAFRGG